MSITLAEMALPSIFPGKLQSSEVSGALVYGTRANVPDYVVTHTATFRIVADHLGSVRLVVNSVTGTVVQRLEYDEFGREIINTNPGFQPFGYAGGLTDDLTGFVRFGARDYHPIAGRWTAKEPRGIERSVNRYDYVGTRGWE